MAIGLRERKKAATRARIIACAVQMFREQGYEASRIEDIAEAADLSVATFYNYFGSKADMLLATVLTETEVIVKAVDECIAKPHTDLKKAFAEIVSIYFSMSFQMTSRELWREALARTMLDPEAEFSLRYTDIDQRLKAQLQTFLRNMQEREIIAKQIDTDALGQLLFNNVNMNFVETMRSPQQPGEEVCRKVMYESAPVLELCEQVAGL